MKILTSIIAALSLSLSGCSTFKSGGVKPFINATVLYGTKNYLEKHPSNVGKILDLAVLIETAADVTDNTLTKSEFSSLVQRAIGDSDWVILSSYLWDIYSENIIIPEKYGKSSPFLRDLATALRDAATLVAPSK